ncbi:MAG: FAD-dependent monooxygenase [Alphaproteobacteria bacterium]|nr:FAD-dependent monooxygenase [Alphaproteobacteria bacterium]
MGEHSPVLIAGAGPVGLISALALAQRGVPVIVLEAEPALYEDPRAATTHPATLEMLDDLGILEEVERQGLHCRHFRFWDRISGDMVAEFDHQLLENDCRFPYVIQCEQFKTASITYDALTALPGTEVRFSHRVAGLAQDGDGVTVTVDTPEGTRQLKGAYLIGADGGRSEVRKALGIEFEGFTYPEHFLVLTSPFDFQAHKDLVYRNYFFDPEEWCNLFKVAADGPPGLWRAVFPVDPDRSDAEVLGDENAQATLKRFFPKDSDYEIVHRNLYKIHQRVAVSFRAGRCLLAGDSAHLNNSIGGMGLNGGIHDAVNLADKLAPVWKGEADDRLLDLYDRQRRISNTEFIQAQTIENKKRLEERDMGQRQKRMEELREISEDPVRARAFMLRTSLIASVRRAAEIT